MPLVRGHYPVTNPQWLLDGAPSGVLRSNMSRLSATSNLSALSSGVMLSAALPLEDGDVVSALTFVSGTTAASSPTNWWFALYGPDGALISQTADQEDAAWAANTPQTLELDFPYLVPQAGVYYAAVMVAADTPPTLAGRALHNAALSGAVVTGQKVLAQTSGSSLTDTPPTTIATPTAVANVPLVIAT